MKAILLDILDVMGLKFSPKIGFPAINEGIEGSSKTMVATH
jgi:hypothetical protein